MKRKLTIKVEKTESGLQIEFIKNGNSLLHGDGYDRKAGAKKTVYSIVNAILNHNVEYVGIEPPLLPVEEFLWRIQVNDEEGAKGMWNSYLNETEQATVEEILARFNQVMFQLRGNLWETDREQYSTESGLL